MIAVMVKPMPPVFCEKCGRAVESVTIEKPAVSFDGDDGYTASAHTGEIIITVECHGERWSMSNWRGVS